MFQMMNRTLQFPPFKSARKFIAKLSAGEEGLGTIEMVLLVAILIVLALTFKSYILGFFQALTGKVTAEDINIVLPK